MFTCVYVHEICIWHSVFKIYVIWVSQTEYVNVYHCYRRDIKVIKDNAGKVVDTFKPNAALESEKEDREIEHKQRKWKQSWGLDKTSYRRKVGSQKKEVKLLLLLKQTM